MIKYWRKDLINSVYNGNQADFNIPDYLCAEIEVLQKRAFRIIAPSLTYSNALEYMNMPTLKERRENFATIFLRKTMLILNFKISYQIDLLLVMN